MNLQVFLEWFHRLDAFVIGVALLVVAIAPSSAPIAAPLAPLDERFCWCWWRPSGRSGGPDGAAAAPIPVVTAHLALALTLVALLSGSPSVYSSPAKAVPVVVASVVGLGPLWV